MHIYISFIISLLMMPFMANKYSCRTYFDIHPVGNEFGLQVILKSNGYYSGKIDGQIGNITKSAIKIFQNSVGLLADGVIGSDTCKELLTIKPAQSIKNIKESNVEKVDESLKEVQTKLKDLGLYSGAVDGIKGSNTTSAIKLFQSKAGLIADGIAGSNTKAALEKGEEAYVSITQAQNTAVETTSTVQPISDSALDLSNYNSNGVCIVGYVDTLGIWVPDPCFYPVFVYRFGKVAQVNSAAERDAYITDRWSLTAEKIYTPIGPVNTQNYINGVNSPVNSIDSFLILIFLSIKLIMLELKS